MFYLNFIETIFQVFYFTFSISKFVLDFSKFFLTILEKANCLASIHAMAFSLYFSIHVSRIEKAESSQHGQIKHSITFYSFCLLFPRSKRLLLNGKSVGTIECCPSEVLQYPPQTTNNSPRHKIYHALDVRVQ